MADTLWISESTRKKIEGCLNPPQEAAVANTNDSKNALNSGLENKVMKVQFDFHSFAPY